MPLSELKQRTTFRGLNPLAERSVLVALQRRYKVLLAKELSLGAMSLNILKIAKKYLSKSWACFYSLSRHEKGSCPYSVVN